MKGHLLPLNEAAVIEIAEALRSAIADSCPNSIITLMVKIDPHGRVSVDSSMDVRRFPLRDSIDAA